MPIDSLALLLQTWQVFCPCLTRPAFARMLVVATGWVLTHARTRAVTEALVVLRREPNGASDQYPLRS